MGENLERVIISIGKQLVNLQVMFPPNLHFNHLCNDVGNWDLFLHNSLDRQEGICSLILEIILLINKKEK